MTGRMVAWLSMMPLMACSSGGGEPGGASSCPHQLVVATYNIRFDNPDDGVHRWSSRRSQVGEQVRALGADIVSMQEVLADQLDDIVAMTPGYAHEGIGRDGGRRGEHTPLFYRTARFARLDGGTFWPACGRSPTR